METVWLAVAVRCSLLAEELSCLFLACTFTVGMCACCLCHPQVALVLWEVVVAPVRDLRSVDKVGALMVCLHGCACCGLRVGMVRAPVGDLRPVEGGAAPNFG